MAYRVYHPRSALRTETPEDLEMAFEVHSIGVAGARPLTLDAWFIRAPQAAHTVVVAHAWGAQKADRLKYARFLHRCGFNVLLFDLRNHGRSGRDPALLRMLGKKSWPPPLDGLQAGVLFIVGEHDVLMPVPEVSELAARAAGAELWVVPGARHLKTFRSRPDEYAERVRAFLDERLGGV